MNKGMILESIRMAGRQVASSKKRTVLTSLGICIGITAVISLITLVQGISGEVVGQFSSLGSDSLTVAVTGSVLKSGLKDEDMETIGNLPCVRGVSPSVSGSTSVVYNREVYEDVSITGRNADYFVQNDEVVIKGRRFTEADEITPYEYVCIINEDLANDAFPNQDPIGETIVLAGRHYTVVGVSGDEDSIASAFSSSDEDYAVILPLYNAKKILGVANYNSLTVYLSDGYTHDEAETILEACLDELFNYKDDCYSIVSLDSLLETLESIESMLTWMLAGIASISLLVGGIGIMNMMLVSVSERTKEIGLRKALGAEPRQIQFQFVVESIILSLIGGAAGIFIGCMISFIAGKIMGITIIPSLWAILLGVGFSAAVGIGFGWGPSKTASALHPIDALRTD